MSFFTHTPGLKVVSSFSGRCWGLLTESINDPNPVMFLSTKAYIDLVQKWFLLIIFQLKLELLIC